jgi:hypothetical protein
MLNASISFPWWHLQEVEYPMRRFPKISCLVFAFLLLASSYLVCKTQAASDSAAIPGVQVQVVDSLRGTASFALDSADNPHVCCVDGGIKYAWWNGSEWNTQVVDTVGDGMSCHLALDSKGNPYITYRYLDASNHPYLKYAHWDGSTWKIQILDSGGDYSSIVVDSNDNPHIAYYGRMSLHYASWDGTKWNIETVESGGKKAPDGSYNATGWWVSLKLDSNDNPHISYYRPTSFESSGEVKYASWDGTSWIIQDVEPIGSDYYIHTSLALDSKGNPHIAYRGDTGLRYAVWAGSGWDIQTVDYSLKRALSVGEWASLVLDSNDIPHICYIDSYRFSVLKYAFLNGSTWRINALTPSFHAGYSISIALDSKGKIHICRDDTSTLTLNHIIIDQAKLPPPTQLPDPPLQLAMFPPSSEPASPAGTIGTIDSPGCCGAYTSLTLDSQGNPHISYFDRNIDELRYAYCNGSTWYAQTVDTDGWVGIYSSLALDASDYPHISYLDNFNNKIKYAEWNGSAWAIQTVDSIGSLYSFTSIALDAEGYPHISYFDGGNYSLKYAKWNGFTWGIQTVDSAGVVGEYSSLKLDSNGYPHISYYDASQGDLKYARWTGTNWNIQVVDSTDNVGLSTSLVLDSQGNPHISYCDLTNNLLKYACLTGSSWNIQTVDIAKYGGYVKWVNNNLDYTSLALNSKDNPFISYVDGDKRNLKLAFWNGSSWIIQTVDSTFDSGWSSSLALDSNDRVHISYYEGWTKSDLRYVTSADNSTYFPKPAPIWLPPPTNSSNSSASTIQDSKDGTNSNKTQTDGKTAMNELSSSLQNINTDSRDWLEKNTSSTMEKQETFRMELVLTASGAPAALIGIGLLVYFRKRNR